MVVVGVGFLIRTMGYGYSYGNGYGYDKNYGVGLWVVTLLADMDMVIFFDYG